MTRYTHVHTPISIGGVTLKNRIFRPGHGTGLGLMGIGEDFIAFHEDRARGGVALTILEILSVHAASPSFLPPISAEHMAAGYKRLVDRIAPHGMALFQQIWHGGHNAVLFDGSSTWSASDVPSPFCRVIQDFPMS